MSSRIVTVPNLLTVFRMVLIPVFVSLLFYQRFLLALSIFILAGVIANMHIYFRPASLFNTLVMLILLVGGLGLIARALRPHPATKSE